MADILKISTPLVEKMPVQTVRPSADPSVPFNLSDVTRVAQTATAAELLQQNTGHAPAEAGPKILADLLRDPAVTVSMIRNIYMLQEIIGLVPANNTALTEEVRRLFDLLLLSPGELPAELALQERNATMFKGEVFDMLRGVLAEQGGRHEVATAIGVLLKGLNAAVSQRDALDSVAGNLTFLADSLSSSTLLSGRLNELTAALRADDAPEHFPELKQAVTEALQEVENSVLFSPKLAKILPLVVYNLSRYNDNKDFLPDALRLLLNSLDADVDKTELVAKLQRFLDKFIPEKGAAPPAEHAARLAGGEEGESRVMTAISGILSKHAESEELAPVSGERLEKIVHSLLSSPSNFTPLLHFVLPVEQGELRAFAEIWIDPDAEGETGARSGGGAADNLHMLMVFDVEGFGRFETEMFVQDRRIALSLMCPPAYAEQFQGLGPAIRGAVAATGYRFDSINIGRLERTRSLMDVFTDLPHRRTGIDVKI